LLNEFRETPDEKQAKPYQKSWIDYFGTWENNRDQGEINAGTERGVAQGTLSGYTISQFALSVLKRDKTKK